MKRKELILRAAGNEFLEKGYMAASMRDIAYEADISAAALYRHFDSKEKIFEAVIEPALSAWDAFLNSESERQTALGRNESLDAMWKDTDFSKGIVDLIYAHYKENRLLFTRAEGTRYENYLHGIVCAVQKQTIGFVRELEAAGVSVSPVDERSLHLLLSAEYSAMLEMIRHDFTYEEAKEYAETVSSFFREG